VSDQSASEVYRDNDHEPAGLSLLYAQARIFAVSNLDRPYRGGKVRCRRPALEGWLAELAAKTDVPFD
jgi:hypothetical protein